MERHTYINTKRSTSKKEYAHYKRTCSDSMPETYDWWREKRHKREVSDFIKALWEMYPDDSSPLVRRTETTVTSYGAREREVTYNDTVVALTLIASAGTNLKVSSRKDGIFTEQTVRYIDGHSAVIRNHLEFLDEVAVRLWIEEGDDALCEMLSKDKTHIVNGDYNVLCDHVLV